MEFSGKLLRFSYGMKSSDLRSASLTLNHDDHGHGHAHAHANYHAQAYVDAGRLMFMVMWNPVSGCWWSRDGDEH